MIKIEEPEAQNIVTALKHLLVNNLDVAANKGKKKDNFHQFFFGFCKTITKHLGNHLTFRTADFQGIVFTLLANNIAIKNIKLFSYFPILSPDAQTQIMFKESISKSFILSFDSWSTERKPVNTQLEYQVD